MVFAFARNFVNLGDDGRFFKRYLVHDPFSPVSFLQLFCLSLRKLALFYVFRLLVVIMLLRSWLGKRMLVLLALNSLPVVVFASSSSPDRSTGIFRSFRCSSWRSRCLFQVTGPRWESEAWPSPSSWS